WYQGARFGLTRRLSGGWSTSANYTYSKCTNEGEPGGAGDIGNAYPVPIADITSSHPRPDTATNKGPCVADRRHNFNLSAVLVSAGFGGGFLKTVTRDWQTGIIWQARSGSPITPTTTGDTALTNLPQRPILVPGSTSRRSRRIRRASGVTRRRAILSARRSGTWTRRCRATST